MNYDRSYPTLAAFFLACAAAMCCHGCHSANGHLRIRGLVIPKMTEYPEEYRLLLRMEDVLYSGGSVNETRDAALIVVDRCNAGLVATAIIVLVNSVTVERDEELVRVLARACLESQDSMIRWAGIYALSKISVDEAVCELLEENYASLATRPDYSSLTDNAIDVLQPPNALAGMRAHLLRLTPQCNPRLGSPLLRAIVNDRHEWHGPTREAAQEALAHMEDQPARN